MRTVFGRGQEAQPEVTMIDDLTMLATLPVCEDHAEKVRKDDEPATTAQSEADKAAAGETMPPPKDKDGPPFQDDTKADRVARRGQDASEQE